MANSNSSSICAPAMLYLVLSIIAIVVMVFQKCELVSLIFNVLFVALWTWFLNFLCSKGYTVISWVLVLLPFIFFILMMVFAYEVFKKVVSQKMAENFTNHQKDKKEHS